MLKSFYCYHIIIVYYNHLKVTPNIRHLHFCLIFLTHSVDKFFRNALQKNQEKSIISRYAMDILAIVIIVFDTNYNLESSM